MEHFLQPNPERLRRNHHRARRLASPRSRSRLSTLAKILLLAAFGPRWVFYRRAHTNGRLWQHGWGRRGTAVFTVKGEIGSVDGAAAGRVEQLVTGDFFGACNTVLMGVPCRVAASRTDAGHPNFTA